MGTAHINNFEKLLKIFSWEWGRGLLRSFGYTHVVQIRFLLPSRPAGSLAVLSLSFILPFRFPQSSLALHFLSNETKQMWQQIGASGIMGIFTR